MIRIGIYVKLIAQFMGLRQANVYHGELAEFISKQNSSNFLLGGLLNWGTDSFNPFVTSGTYIPLTKSLFKSAGITVCHFFSMLPSTLKYLHSAEPVRMHFPAKQPYCTNDTVCNAACCIAHSIICTARHGKKWDTVIPADFKRLFVSGTYMSRWSRKG